MLLLLRHLKYFVKYVVFETSYIFIRWREKLTYLKDLKISNEIISK